MLHFICYLLDLYLMLMIIRKYSVGKKNKQTIFVFTASFASPTEPENLFM